MEEEPTTSAETGKHPKNQSKIFNDPIWGPIKLNHICVKIIDTPEFQRLRFIKQLGGCSFVYPGAIHTRFEHSIGTSYLAGLLVRSLRDKLQLNPEYNIDIKEKDILCVEIAGLCHDLGHGAFSHLFEGLFIPKIKGNKDWKHEKASIEMMSRIFDNDRHGLKQSAEEFVLNNMNKDVVGKIADEDKLSLEKGSKDRAFIEGLIRGEIKEESVSGRGMEKNFFYEIVANEKNKIDVDKWDYFSRDCHMLGMKHNFQIMRSIKLARVIKHDDGYHISFPVSEYMNIFDMYHARYTLHRRAYQHPVNKAVELMITDALYLVNEKLKYRVGVGDEKREKILSKTIDDMEAYTLVTDGIIDRIRFENFEKEKEEKDEKELKEKIQKAKKIIDRLFVRDFYKCGVERRVKEPTVVCDKCKMERRVKDDEEANKEEKKKFTEDQQIKNEQYQKKIKKLIDDEDIHVEPVVFDYGADEVNPMGGVKFYRGDVSHEPTYDEISGMLPSCFQETYLRMYWKKSSEEGKDEAMRAFKSLYELNLNGKRYSLNVNRSQPKK